MDIGFLEVKQLDFPDSSPQSLEAKTIQLLDDISNRLTIAYPNEYDESREMVGPVHFLREEEEALFQKANRDASISRVGDGFSKQGDIFSFSQSRSIYKNENCSTLYCLLLPENAIPVSIEAYCRDGNRRLRVTKLVRFNELRRYALYLDCYAVACYSFQIKTEFKIAKQAFLSERTSVPIEIEINRNKFSDRRRERLISFNKMNLLQKLSIPDGVSTAFLVLSTLLFLAPYISLPALGLDETVEQYRPFLKWLGPLLLGICFILFIPMWTSSKKKT